ncbi:MAG: hypothetical protein M5U18_13155 [Dehalococcoidia bacterium]|nr:hypothetical protein [Dehalococcoidia bacterium]
MAGGAQLEAGAGGEPGEDGCAAGGCGGGPCLGSAPTGELLPRARGLELEGGLAALQLVGDAGELAADGEAVLGGAAGAGVVTVLDAEVVAGLDGGVGGEGGGKLGVVVVDGGAEAERNGVLTPREGQETV